MRQRPHPTLADGAMSRSRSDPDFWMYETSGVMRPAVTAYLKGKPMTAKHIAAFRVYLRVWIFTPEFVGDGVEALRQTEVLTLTEKKTPVRILQTRMARLRDLVRDRNAPQKHVWRADRVA